MTARSPLLPNPTFNSGVIPIYPTWTCPSQLQTPANQSIHYRHHMDTTCPSQLQAPIYQCIQCRPRIDTTLSCPRLLQVPTTLSLDSRPCMGTACTSWMDSKPCKDILWNNPPLIETTPILNNGPRLSKGTIWTGPPQLQTRTNLRTDSRPFTPRTCSPQIPTPSNINYPMNDYRPHIDTKTLLTQKPNTNTVHHPKQYTDLNNPTVNLDRKPETANSKTSHDTPSSNVKSLMDYTWLTRAHYANINQPNKNANIVKLVSQSQNTEKRVEGTPTNSLAKELFKPTLFVDRENINEAECKQNVSKELLYSETNARRLACIRKSIDLNIANKEKREKDKNTIKKEIQTLETNIKKLTSNKKPYKIPKHSDSKKDYIKSKVETDSKTQPKKTTPDKSKKTEKQTPKKRTHNPEETYKKRVRPNIENNEHSISKIRKLRHSSSLETDQRPIREEISSHPKSKKEIHINEQKDKKSSGLQCIDKNRSKRVETHSSERLQKKRERRDSSYESTSKKQFSYKLENITKNNNETRPIKSVVTRTKSAKHPRIEAPDSDDSDDDFEYDLDLRSKLSRGSHKRYKRSHDAQTKDKIETPQKNLVITVNRNDDDQTTTSPKPGVPGPSFPKQKSKKYKKIRLVIKVIQEDTSGDSSSDDSKNNTVSSTDISNESFAKRNLDLSFLDDFNVDEIVNSLKHNPKLDNVQQNIKQKVEITKTLAESVTNTFVRPIIIKKETQTEQVDPKVQSNVTYPGDSNPDNITDSE